MSRRHDSAASIRTERLAKRFGGVVATEGVDLAIRRGEIRCIIGPNGAGKSTLFSLLCGIYRPDAGRMLLHDRDVTRLPAFRRVRMGLGLTFQTNRAFHALTVGQNLDIATRAFDVDLRRTPHGATTMPSAYSTLRRPPSCRRASCRTTSCNGWRS